MATKNKLRAIDLLMELRSFVPVRDNDLETALGSGVNEDNPAFARQLDGWKIGLYDEDPDTLRDEIIRMCHSKR